MLRQKARKPRSSCGSSGCNLLRAVAGYYLGYFLTAQRVPRSSSKKCGTFHTAKPSALFVTTLLRSPHSAGAKLYMNPTIHDSTRCGRIVKVCELTKFNRHVKKHCKSCLRPVASSTAWCITESNIIYVDMFFPSYLEGVPIRAAYGH